MTATLPCPTCGDRVPFGDAEHGDVLLCPACEGAVTVRRAPRVIRAKSPVAPRHTVLRSLGVATGLLMMLFGVCGLAGYLVYDHVADPEFTAYADAEGRFSVEFPCRKPSRIEPTAWTADGPVSYPAVMCERSVPDEAYMVAWIDLPRDRLLMGAEAILNDACTGAAAYNPKMAKELSREPIRCGNHPGYEMICAVQGTQGKGILRAILAGKRLYLLFVGGGFIQHDSERARYFLDSFQIR